MAIVRRRQLLSVPRRVSLGAVGLLGAILLMLAFLPRDAAADSPIGLTGEVPSSGGMSLVVWGGGPVDGMTDTLSGSGCRPASVWAAASSGLVGYVFGAPAPVNSAFAGRFPGGQLPAQTPLVLVCSVETHAAATTVAPSVFDATSEARMLVLVNQERTSRGLVALVRDEALTAVARAHSLDMQERDYFAHTNPEGLSPFDRMSAAGISYGWAAENLAWGPGVEWGHQGLMESPGHRANILNPELRRVGIGVVGPANGQQYFTQAFTD